ncbi:MAG: NAD-dependent epimerase/dehydratase family protein [Dehalococcoidales bacterium]|nr:NAD-dependent epimerase/dehydratase family protein [Dehalococcoidales bacterium]
MKVLVTGASGFIGGNLARELVGRGYSVRALVRRGSNTRCLNDLDIEIIEGDLLDSSSLERAMAGCEAVFHAAALYTFWSATPQMIYRTNVEGTAAVLSAAGTAGIKRVVYTSSESVIGLENGEGQGNEDGQGDLRRIPGDYKKSKFLAEQVAFKASREGLDVVIVNPTTPVGAYDVKPTPTGKIITDYLNHKMFACVNTGLNVIDVEDVARGHILALEKGRSGQRYLLGNRNMTLREIMALLEKISGIRASRLTLPLWTALMAGYADELIEGKILRRYPRIPLAAVKASSHFRHFDCSRAVKELGLPQTPVEESFRKAVKWFRENGYAG